MKTTLGKDTIDWFYVPNFGTASDYELVVDKEGKQDEPFQFKYHYNILTGTEVNEKPKSWGSFYYNWKTRKG